MRRPALIAAALAAIAGIGASGPPPDRPTAPFADRRAAPLEYSGPGRDEAAPPGLADVAIGWFGPSDPGDPAAGGFWEGAILALDEINAEGGVAGLPARLVPGWSENPWAGGAKRLTEMVYRDRVWAILGSVDGAATHLAEQVAAKALVPVLSPGSTDSSVSLAGVPWIFTLLPDDDAQAEAVAGHLAARGSAGPLALVSATDHDSRAAAAEWLRALARAGLPPGARLQCSPAADGAEAIAAQALAGSPRTVILLASPAASARLALALRGAGFGGTIAGGASLARRGFVASAGQAAEGAILPLLHDPRAERWEIFCRSFAARFGHAPDFAAGAAYDALRLAVEAARRGGLNRARIRDAVAAQPSWPGVLGDLPFDGLGRNVRPVLPGTIRAGAAVALPPPAPGAGSVAGRVNGCAAAQSSRTSPSG